MKPTKCPDSVFRRWVLAAGLLLLASSGYAEVTQISLQEAREIYDLGEKALFLDVRTVSEYEDGHIPGAVNMPRGDYLEAHHHELPDDSEIKIIVYCKAGGRSDLASKELDGWGHENIYNIDDDGFDDWKRLPNAPIEYGPASTPTPDPTATVSPTPTPTIAPTPTPTSTPIPGDLSQNGVLDPADLFLLTRCWREAENETNLSGDGGMVDQKDLLWLLQRLTAR